MRSILTVMSIESMVQKMRTLIEADNPALAEVVTDIVSGGTGSELYPRPATQGVPLRVR